MYVICMCPWAWILANNLFNLMWSWWIHLGDLTSFLLCVYRVFANMCILPARQNIDVWIKTHEEWRLASFISMQLQLPNKQTWETGDIGRERARLTSVCSPDSARLWGGKIPQDFSGFHWWMDGSMDGRMEISINWQRTSEMWTGLLHHSGCVRWSRITCHTGGHFCA